MLPHSSGAVRIHFTQCSPFFAAQPDCIAAQATPLSHSHLLPPPTDKYLLGSQNLLDLSNLLDSNSRTLINFNQTTPKSNHEALHFHRCPIRRLRHGLSPCYTPPHNIIRTSANTLPEPSQSPLQRGPSRRHPDCQHPLGYLPDRVRRVSLRRKSLSLPKRLALVSNKVIRASMAPASAFLEGAAVMVWCSRLRLAGGTWMTLRMTDAERRRWNRKT